MKILLFINFNTPLPNEFISFITEKFPALCSTTVQDKQDFNRWDIEIRTNRQTFSAIKQYEKTYGSMDEYFKYTQSTNKTKGFILVDTETHEEFWDETKK